MLITPQKMVHSVYIAMVFIIFCIVVVKMSSGCATADVEKLEASAVRVEQAAETIEQATQAVIAVTAKAAQSAKTIETATQAVVAISNAPVDNSSSDRWLARLLVATLGVALLGLLFTSGTRKVAGALLRKVKR